MLYLTYLERHAEVCGVLKAFDESFQKVCTLMRSLAETSQLDETDLHCQRAFDRLLLKTLKVRQLIAGAWKRIMRLVCDRSRSVQLTESLMRWTWLLKHSMRMDIIRTLQPHVLCWI